MLPGTDNLKLRYHLHTDLVQSPEPAIPDYPIHDALMALEEPGMEWSEQLAEYEWVREGKVKNI